MHVQLTRLINSKQTLELSKKGEKESVKRDKESEDKYFGEMVKFAQDRKHDITCSCPFIVIHSDTHRQTFKETHTHTCHIEMLMHHEPLAK